MKNLLFIFCVLACTSVFAQQEWGDLQKNELTLKELAPIWPGCEKGTAPQRDTCFRTKLAQHIAKNFKYPAKEYKSKTTGKVIVTFNINEKGLPDVTSVSGGTPGLQKAAKENIMAIPKMSKPGMMGGKPRAIEYIVPFNFKLK